MYQAQILLSGTQSKSRSQLHMQIIQSTTLNCHAGPLKGWGFHVAEIKTGYVQLGQNNLSRHFGGHRFWAVVDFLCGRKDL